ncbi:MAG: hypothetical protein LBI10_00960 [Deltaproteobacteria bacterium]|jgi:hypothetical protein|nr:hypothetical protein [Deltaproteobacteria bacterium]
MGSQKGQASFIETFLTENDNRKDDRSRYLQELTAAVEPSFPSIFKAARVTRLLRRGPKRLLQLDKKLRSLPTLNEKAKDLANKAFDDLRFVGNELDSLFDLRPWRKLGPNEADRLDQPFLDEELDRLYGRIVGTELFLEELEKAWPAILAEIIRLND